MFDNHKKQLEILQRIPDTVPYDPEHAAKALEFEFQSEPDFRSFLPNLTSVEASNISEEEVENKEVLEEAQIIEDTENLIVDALEDNGATV